jgi:hypothetical protein
MGSLLAPHSAKFFPDCRFCFSLTTARTNADSKFPESKVFPEPIVGDELLAAIERAEETPKDAPDLFQVVDVLQMCCLSRRSGAVQMVKEEKNGLVFLRNGKIVHAETTTARGRDALFEIVSWNYVEFAYERTVRPPLETITSEWDEMLIAAVRSEKDERKSRQQSA